MTEQPIEVYAVGPTTVVGFGGRDLSPTVNLAACREWLVQLVHQQACQVLAFDLTGVRHIPSGLLGVLASMRNEGVEVHLYNPSEDVQEVLEITHLQELMPIHFINVQRPGQS